MVSHSPSWLRHLKNGHLLVSPAWLARRIGGVCPSADASLLVFEASPGGPAESRACARSGAVADCSGPHVPGARHFDTHWIEGAPLWNLHDACTIERNLLEVGITADTQVVLYGDDPLPVLRVFWALTWAGVRDVRYLNGGMRAWLRQGLPVQTGFCPSVPANVFGASIPAQPQVNLSMPADVMAAQKAHGLKLVSNRSRAEYIGAISGYDYIATKGEPTGAIWGHAGTDASNMADYFEADGTLRDPREIFALWEKQGIRRGDHLAFYCGTGWRASVAWFITWLAGWKNTCVYDGGWLAWQLDPALPVQCEAGAHSAVRENGTSAVS